MMERKWLAFALIGIAIIAGVIAISITSPQAQLNESLKKFSSAEDIKAFLQRNAAQDTGSYGGIPPFSRNSVPASNDKSASESIQGGTILPSPGTTDHSTTNVQVQGVDEADFVKNDGKYIYEVSGSTLYIVEAYPPADAKVLSEITIPGSPGDLYIKGDRLLVFSSKYGAYASPVMGMEKVASGVSSAPYWPGYNRADVVAQVYSVRDHNKPSLVQTYTVRGSYVASRMIDNYVYLVTSEGAYYYADQITVPAVKSGNAAEIMPDVYYIDTPVQSYAYQTIAGINIDAADEIHAKSFLLDYASSVFVSLDNLYIARTTYLPDNPIIRPPMPVPMAQGNPESAVVKAVDVAVTNTAAQGPEPAEVREKTIVHKFSLKQGEATHVADGEVVGHPLNQFSMDESGGNFRITTTVDGWTSRGNIQFNNLYVLDGAMKTIGKLEQIAPGERIYSTRFIGDRAYMVTFRRIDPLFVIDLSAPEKPKVLGELKIPGYSDYLHPYDQNHIIGIGKETSSNDWGGVSIKGVKLALFDVSDVANPKLIDSYEIGASGTDSEALQDHRAFLFEKERNLLVIPVRDVRTVKAVSGPYYEYSPPRIWQGAYVFGVNTTGFNLKGTITHYEGTDDGYYYSSPAAVRRSLYMGNVLYTVSNQKILANDLTNFEKILAEVNLSNTGYYYPVK